MIYQLVVIPFFVVSGGALYEREGMVWRTSGWADRGLDLGGGVWAEGRGRGWVRRLGGGGGGGDGPHRTSSRHSQPNSADLWRYAITGGK